MDLHLSRDLCDALCGTLRREDWASLCTRLTAFALDFNVVLWDDATGRCFEAVSAWLKGARWKVLAAMREKKREAEPSWELTWRSVADLVTGPEPDLLCPVALARVLAATDPHYTPEPPICTKATLRLGRGIASGGLPA